MYGLIRKLWYWSHMTNVVYTTIRDCRSCAKDRVNDKKQGQFELFFDDKNLAYVGKDILGLLPKPKPRNQYDIVMKNVYVLLPKVIPTPKSSAKTDACILLEHLMASFGIPLRRVTDKSPQRLSKCFMAVCSTLGVTKSTTIKYHRHTNGLAEWYNSKVVSWQLKYVCEYQADWHIYLLSVTYTYKVQLHRSIRLSSFN